MQASCVYSVYVPDRTQSEKRDDSLLHLVLVFERPCTSEIGQVTCVRPWVL